MGKIKERSNRIDTLMKEQEDRKREAKEREDGRESKKESKSGRKNNE